MGRVGAFGHCFGCLVESLRRKWCIDDVIVKSRMSLTSNHLRLLVQLQVVSFKGGYNNAIGGVVVVVVFVVVQIRTLLDGISGVVGGFRKLAVTFVAMGSVLLGVSTHQSLQPHATL